MNVLLTIFDEFLDQAPDSSAQDIIRQSVIILTGSLAKHLAKTDPKVLYNYSLFALLLILICLTHICLYLIIICFGSRRNQYSPS